MSKKRKTRHVALNDLSWQPVVRTHAAGLDFDEGLLELEEVAGVQVQYHQTANGRVAAFIVGFLYQSWAFEMCMFLIRLRWMTRKTHRQRLRSKRLDRSPSHLKRSPRLPSLRAVLSPRLIVCIAAGLVFCQTFELNARFHRSEESTTGMAPLLTPPAAICNSLFTEICKPDSNSVSDHTKGTRQARYHWHCRDRPFIGF